MHSNIKNTKSTIIKLPQYLDNKKKLYKRDGYCKIDEVFKENFIELIKKDIIKLSKKGSYKDKYGKIRRVEKIYDKTKNLKKLNKILKDIIYKILKKKLEIFKDKCHFKPPGGAGFKAHYDGVFYFFDKNNKKRKGWYEYSNYFVNALVALDFCDKKNGTLELAKAKNKKYEELILDTYQDGSPLLKKTIEKKIKFRSFKLLPGDILLFSNKCPHRSKKNNSKKTRKILYYTYSNCGISGYKKYFKDKDESLNKNSKSLT